MNFKKLQAMQLELDNSILSAKPQMSAEERFNKTLVALSVEVAEVANCAEHFKFWKDGKGKVDGDRFVVTSSLVNKLVNGDLYDTRERLYISKEQAHHLTLLEECSDCLHFILSLANQNNFDIYDVEYHSLISRLLDFPMNRLHSLESDYLSLQKCIQKIDYVLTNIGNYKEMIQLVACFIIYFEKLGIATTELEQAYYEKNEENYRRLREGY